MMAGVWDTDYKQLEQSIKEPKFADREFVITKYGASLKVNDAAKNQKAINDVATISKFPSSDALDAFPNRIPAIRRIGATISRTIMPITYGASFRFRGFASLFLP